MGSKITFNIDKEGNFSEWYSEIIQKAEIADIRYGVKGFIVIRPWGARIIEKMYKFYELELQKSEHEPSFFPMVIPEENFRKESSHVEGFTPEVFWLEIKQGEEKIALRPTGETEFYQMYNLWIRSHRDLPLKMYQRGSVFRYETKATRPLIRGREFWWIEAHDCFETSKEAEEQVQKDIETTENVMHKIFGVPFLPLRRPDWDKFPGAVYTVGSDSLMPDGKIIQQPSTHFLGQHFSEAFDIKYVDKNEEEKYVWQTCYGPAISRILSSVISLHGDNNGLILPYSISPYQVVIIPMHSDSKKLEIVKMIENISDVLMKNNIDVKIDNSDKRVGEKFFHWEMKGVPFKIEIGERELKNNEITISVRDTKDKVKIRVGEIVEKIEQMGKEYDLRLKKRADDFFYNRIIECETKEKIKNTLKEGKIAKFNFCNINSEGEKCAEDLEKDMDGEIRGIRFDKNRDVSTGNCVFCNEKSNVVVYAGKSY